MILLLVAFATAQLSIEEHEERRSILENCSRDSKNRKVYLDVNVVGAIAVCAQWVMCTPIRPGKTNACDSFVGERIPLKYAKARYSQQVPWMAVKSYCCVPSDSPEENYDNIPPVPANVKLGTGEIIRQVPKPAPQVVQPAASVQRPKAAVKEMTGLERAGLENVVVGICPISSVPNRSRQWMETVQLKRPPLPSKPAQFTCAVASSQGKKCMDDVRWQFDMNQKNADVGQNPTDIKFKEVCCRPKPSYTCEDFEKMGKRCGTGYEFDRITDQRSKMPGQKFQYVEDCWRTGCCIPMHGKDFKSCSDWRVNNGMKCENFRDGDNIPQEDKQGTSSTKTSNFQGDCCQTEVRKPCHQWFYEGMDCANGARGGVNVGKILESRTAVRASFYNSVSDPRKSGCCEYPAENEGFKIQNVPVLGGLMGMVGLGDPRAETELSDKSKEDDMKHPSGVFAYENSDDNLEVQVNNKPSESASFYNDIPLIILCSILVTGTFLYKCLLKDNQEDEYIQTYLLEDEF